MADPIDMIVPLLREMRAENSGLHEQTRGLIRTLERRLGAIEQAQTSYRQALTADSLLSKLVTGEFEERIEALERKVRELENLK
jgi:polyhydroxyalkanoate synthesis regulator phasin